MDKTKVHKAAQIVLQGKIKELSLELDEIQSSLQSATKSSVGDKHETARAMIQIEQERLAKQMGQQRQLLDMVNSIDSSHQAEKIESGTLVHLSTGWFFISAGIGQLNVDDTIVFCLSPATPLGQQLLGKVAGEKIHLNQEIEILEIY